MATTTRLASWTLVAILSSTLACGTLLYPERRGMDDPDQIDPAVVLMDGVLLLFFVVPGVVAFAVDVATGAIYEPEGSKLVRRDADEPLRIAASQARRLSVGLTSGHAERRLDPIWWEAADGRRIPTRVVADVAPGRYRLESEVELEPGPHRLVLTSRDGSEHGILVETF